MADFGKIEGHVLGGTDGRFWSCEIAHLACQSNSGGGILGYTYIRAMLRNRSLKDGIHEQDLQTKG